MLFSSRWISGNTSLCLTISDVLQVQLFHMQIENPQPKPRKTARCVQTDDKTLIFRCHAHLNVIFLIKKKKDLHNICITRPARCEMFSAASAFLVRSATPPPAPSLPRLPQPPFPITATLAQCASSLKTNTVNSHTPGGRAVVVFFFLFVFSLLRLPPRFFHHSPSCMRPCTRCTAPFRPKTNEHIMET